MFPRRGDDPIQSLISTQQEIVDHFNQLSRQVAALHQQSEISVMKSVQAAQFDAAARYTSVIMVAGYVAFFAMWGSLKDDLSRGSVLWSGLLMVFSLVCFVGFEVAKMILLAVSQQRILAAAAEAHGPPLPSAIQDVLQRENRKLTRVWKYALIPTLVAGFGSAGILGWGFIHGLGIAARSSNKLLYGAPPVDAAYRLA